MPEITNFLLRSHGPEIVNKYGSGPGNSLGSAGSGSTGSGSTVLLKSGRLRNISVLPTY